MNVGDGGRGKTLICPMGRRPELPKGVFLQVYKSLFPPFLYISISKVQNLCPNIIIIRV